MGLYCKKPVVIEAFCWTGGPDQTEDPEWIVERIKGGSVWFVNSGTDRVEIRIRTLEGIMTGMPGDWIIKGIKGEIYPCKPDIFMSSYEKADSE